MALTPKSNGLFQGKKVNVRIQTFFSGQVISIGNNFFIKNVFEIPPQCIGGEFQHGYSKAQSSPCKHKKKCVNVSRPTISKKVCTSEGISVRDDQMSISTNWRQLLHRVCCCQEADHGRRPANWSPDARLQRYIANIASLDRCLASIGNTMVNDPQKHQS